MWQAHPYPPSPAAPDKTPPTDSCLPASSHRSSRQSRYRSAPPALSAPAPAPLPANKSPLQIPPHLPQLRHPPQSPPRAGPPRPSPDFAQSIPRPVNSSRSPHHQTYARVQPRPRAIRAALSVRLRPILSAKSPLVRSKISRALQSSAPAESAPPHRKPPHTSLSRISQKCVSFSS